MPSAAKRYVLLLPARRDLRRNTHSDYHDTFSGRRYQLPRLCPRGW